MPKALIFLCLLVAGLPVRGFAAGPDAPAYLYISSTVFAEVYEVEIATGNRRVLDLNDYPRIIKATDLTVESAGTFLIETVDALQRTGIFRVDPGTGARSPVSGGVDGFDPDLLGAGPPFAPSLNTLLRFREQVFALRDLRGPMAVALPEGDRRIILDDEADAVFTRPDDMVVLDSGDLLIADRFDGLWRVDQAKGHAAPVFAPGQIAQTPRRMDRLSDAELVFLMQDPESDALWTLNLKTGEQTLYSGSFGGHSVGDGPEFVFAYDVAVDPTGRVFVLDGAAHTILAVAANGNRTVVTSPEVGAGPLFFDLEYRPTLATWERPAPVKAGEPSLLVR